jgi:hypothetical protein
LITFAAEGLSGDGPSGDGLSGNDNDKYRGLSAPQWTVKLSIASVEMT